MATVNKTETVTIGDHELLVVPQRHARLRRKLSAEDLEGIMSSNYASESYRVLSILIPQLPQKIPLWEWEGYASQEAMDADEYDEESDRSPTTADIINAFETAFMVSGAGRLGKIVDLIQTGVEASGSLQTQTPSSPELPGSNGESASTSTGAKSPTSTASEG